MSETDMREAPGDFGAVLRHELNNPLTGILGNAELLLLELRRKHRDLPVQLQARLETIASLAVRMRETVRRLSEQCEPQTGPPPVEPEAQASAQPLA
jgi:signal transduction histidine kinase